MKIYVEAASVRENYLIGLARLILSTKSYPGKPFIYFSFIDDTHYGYTISTEKIDGTGLYSGQIVYELGPLSLFADLLSQDKEKVEAAQAVLAATQAKLAASVKDESIDTLRKMLAVRSAIEINNLSFSLPLFSNIVKQLDAGGAPPSSPPPGASFRLVDSVAKMDSLLGDFLQRNSMGNAGSREANSAHPAPPFSTPH